MNFLLSILGYLLGLFVGLVLLRFAGVLYFRRYVAWETAVRRGLNYYGKPLVLRKKLREKIKCHALFLVPLLTFEAKLQRLARKKNVASIPSFTYKGVTGPSYSCTKESFHKATTTPPKKQDIFVATQMKCGTTWMQQIVYEVLLKGNGDLSDQGHTHLYAMSPWIESVDSVSMEEAPLIGEKKGRIVKTHLPTQLCPYSPQAKYLYVTRHPVACFGSVVDYFQLMAGPLAPSTRQILDWYLSDQMWWLPWPDHVAGWWDWAEKYPNIAFFHFEEMKKNLEGVVRQVARFLEVDLTEEELGKVVTKSGFQYMKENEEVFEMSPPNLFSVSGTYFRSGKANREVNISEGERRRIPLFCKDRLSGRSYPFARFYPDVAS